MKMKPVGATKRTKRVHFAAFEAVTTKRSNWFAFIGSIHRMHIFWQLMVSNLVVAAYTVGLVWWYEDYLGEPVRISSTMHSILGITLGLLLVFRTNTAYDRWWEGRKLLGNLVNNCRNLAVKFDAMLPPEAVHERAHMAGLISGYCFALKEHLREGVKWEQLQDLEDDLLAELHVLRHVPNRIATEIYSLFLAAKARYNLPAEYLIAIDKQLESFTDVVGACERIKKTPLPISYSMHLKIFILIYVGTLPFGVMHELHYYTIAVTCLVFYAMVGIELIGEQIEDPFGTDENDLPMDAICNTIQLNVYEVLVPEVIHQ
jgi:ion channel-forming bestrophin family protein